MWTLTMLLLASFTLYASASQEPCLKGCCGLRMQVPSTSVQLYFDIDSPIHANTHMPAVHLPLGQRFIKCCPCGENDQPRDIGAPHKDTTQPANKNKNTENNGPRDMPEFARPKDRWHSKDPFWDLNACVDINGSPCPCGSSGCFPVEFPHRPHPKDWFGDLSSCVNANNSPCPCGSSGCYPVEYFSRQHAKDGPGSQHVIAEPGNHVKENRVPVEVDPVCFNGTDFCNCQIPGCTQKYWGSPDAMLAVARLLGAKE